MQQPQQLDGAGFGPPRHHLETELPFGEIHWHQPAYQEFICSRSTASWLQAGAMSRVNDREVTLQIKAEMKGDNVAVGYWFK